jgi:hypothetical protein
VLLIFFLGMGRNGSKRNDGLSKHGDTCCPAMAAGSKTHILKAVKVAVESRELPATESGSMAYMMSTGAYLSNRVGRWRPDLMFFTLNNRERRGRILASDTLAGS